jgi:hypothetical protein
VYIEERTRISSQLAKNDLQDNSITITKIAEKIERLKNKYATNLKKTKGGQPQISTTDQDARAL